MTDGQGKSMDLINLSMILILDYEFELPRRILH